MKVTETLCSLADFLDAKYGFSKSAAEPTTKGPIYEKPKKYETPLSQQLLCKIGKHNWGPKVRMRIRHTSKPNEKPPWAHDCDAFRKFCIDCGKNSPLEDTCSGVIAPIYGEAPKDKGASQGDFKAFQSDKI